MWKRARSKSGRGYKSGLGGEGPRSKSGRGQGGAKVGGAKEEAPPGLPSSRGTSFVSPLKSTRGAESSIPAPSPRRTAA